MTPAEAFMFAMSVVGPMPRSRKDDEQPAVPGTPRRRPGRPRLTDIEAQQQTSTEEDEQ